MRLPPGYRDRSISYLAASAFIAVVGLLVVLATANGAEVLFAIPFAIVGLLSAVAMTQLRSRRRHPEQGDAQS